MDILEDTGKCLSPAVDIGQIEGGFVFGQGLWTTEKIVHDPETGAILTKGTWVSFSCQFNAFKENKIN